jgi:hypothetical protein
VCQQRQNGQDPMAMSNRYTQILEAVLLGGLLVAGGCTKPVAKNAPAAPAQNQPAARTDADISTEVQSRISGESALAGQNIQVAVQNGVATLSGSADNDAIRALAGNDAGGVTGVRTVVNNLTVTPAKPAPAPVVAPPAPKERRHRTAVKQQAAAETPAPPAPMEPPAAAPEPEQVRTVPPPPPPPPQPVSRTVTIASGTTLPIRITDPLETGQTQQGQLFHGTVASDISSGDAVAIPRGTPVTGRVVDAKDAAHFAGSSLLSIELTAVDVNGKQISVVTAPYVQQGKGRGKNTAMKTGGGAAIGAIIGALAGGGKGAAIGAASGGGIGAGVNGVTRGEQVKIPAETLVNFQLQSPVNVTVTTGGSTQAPATYNDGSNNNPQLQQR